MDFPITALRNRYRDESVRCYDEQVASGTASPQLPSHLVGSQLRLEKEILSTLIAQPVSALVIEGYGIPGEYGHSWVEVLQDGPETMLQRCTIPHIHRPDSYHPHEEVLQETNLAGLCEAACARLTRCGFWDWPAEFGCSLVLDGPGAARIWCKQGDRCRRLDVYFVNLPFRHRWLKRFARFWLTASPWRLRLAAWCNRWGRRFRSPAG